MGSGNDVVCVLQMMLLCVHWECCCYLGSGDAVVDCVLKMMLFR